MRAMTRRRCMHQLACVAAGVWGSRLQAAQPQPETPQGLEVLHWWTSASERWALDHVLQKVNRDRLVWRNAPVPGGSRAAAKTVLRSRLLAGSPPDVAHLSVKAVQELAGKGVLLNLAQVRLPARDTLLPLAREAATVEQQWVAVPLGVQRINTLLYHRGLWQQHRLPVPHSWDEVFFAAQRLSAAGVSPLVWHDGGGFLMEVFDSLLLSSMGASAHQTASRGDFWAHPGVLEALRALLRLRALNTVPVPQPQGELAAGRAFLLGQAGMWIMGDGARAELNAWGMKAGVGYESVPVPGTSGSFLYSVDVLSAFNRAEDRTDALATLASDVWDASLQWDYNRAKGTVPVIQGIGLYGLDRAESAVWSDFRDPGVIKLPGFSHRLGMDGLRSEQTAELLQAFVRKPHASASEAHEQLVRLLRVGRAG